MQIYHMDDKVHKWKPAKDQWCWFYNFTYEAPILDKFDHMHSKNMPNGFCFCEPFIGQLPSILQSQPKG